VLGPTGRNFAAGMSGGIAYVLDENGKFGERVNPTMRNQLEVPEEADLIELRGLIEEHRRRTGSKVAERLLDSWAESSSRFVKVFPADYKRVLADLEEESAGVQTDPETDDAVEVIGEPQTVSADREA